jgi:two-component system CheB/CheR fusion protein
VTSPDNAEEERGLPVNIEVPAPKFQKLPMVGLGGSAGSIRALQEFFRGMAVDSGMAFVVVLHLAPEHESSLAQILQHSTTMPVSQATNGQLVEADHVYVIPPGKHLTSIDGKLGLMDLPAERGRRVTVDLFFRTLADTHGPHSAAVILSGADGDGAIGIKRIKECGGLTVAQDPSEAEYPGMPRSAINTGMVDWVLKVQEMPSRLLEYQKRAARLKLPPEEGPQPAQEVLPVAAAGEKELREILVYLRTRTGRDFAYYKRATILRRISRRMQVNGIDELGEYLNFLRTHPGEAGALLQDLLISVTNFFRDRKAFDALEKRIPDLFKGKGPNDAVRVWVVACATGEEAYSIAMLLHEHASKMEASPVIQVFATDLDDGVIQSAREGFYPNAIATDVSEERLRRFFTHEHQGYRIRREIRETVLFALHDLLKDSPFSRLDLISCRNLLIYLNREAQNRVFDIFHFALRPEGQLFLGTSESVEDENQLFSVLDKKSRLYTPRQVPRSTIPMPLRAGTLELVQDARKRFREKVITLPGGGFNSKNPADILSEPDHRSASWSELHFKLLEYFAPPSLIVDQQYEIMHLSENARQFLQFTGGEPTRNLLRVVHPMLRIELRTLLYRAGQTREIVEASQIPIDLEGKPYLLDIRVLPAQKISPDFLLVVFDAHQNNAATVERPAPSPEENSLTLQLEHELEGLKVHMRDVVEQHEASSEEFKASNEELQAMNEELRSATEELETGREELQSMNEELTTVNQELKNNIDQLALSNGDLRNLMASTAIAIVFLDRDLNITRFTPTAVEIFNLIPTDVGRPLTDLAHRMDYPELKKDAERVLEQLTPIEREVSHQGKRHFLARLLPYRTTDDRIGGLVLTFVDITERKRNEEALRESVERMRRAMEVENVGILNFDTKGTITDANDAFLRMTGYTREEMRQGKLRWDEVMPPEWIPRTLQAVDEFKRTGRASTFEKEYLRRDGSRWWGLFTAARLDENSGIEYVLDITERKQAEQELMTARNNLENANKDLEARIHERTVSLTETAEELEAFSYTIAHDMRAPLRAMQGYAALLLAENDSQLNPTGRGYLSRIRIATERLDHLTRDVLSYSRIGRPDWEVSAVDTHKLLVEILDSYPQLQPPLVEINIKNPLPPVRANKAALTLVFSNLLSNAAKFTKPNETAKVTIRSEPAGQFVRFWIEDDGVGMEPQAMKRLFEMFRQINPGRYEGTGIGLAIVKKSVERMGGTVGVESVPNEGSRFWVELKSA